MADRRPPRPRKSAPPRGARPQGPGRRAKPAPSGPRRPAKAPDGTERIQKVLAHAGLGSRRSCEELILQGRVTVDGQVVRELGSKVDPSRSKIAVDGQSIRPERQVYYAVHKPKGYVSTNSDPAGRPRVIDLLPEVPERVYTVGRLDEMSTGLMLLTNDGELANKLAHPRYGVEKLYRAVVAGAPTKEVLGQLTEGVWLAEGKVRAKRVRAVGRKGEATILEMVLAEGKNREVRRMLAKLGHKVMTLLRVAVGPITIKGLSPGQWRPLSTWEVQTLRRVASGELASHVSFSTERKSPRSPARPAQRPAGGADRPSSPEARAEGPRRRAGAGPRPQSGRPPGPASRRPERPGPGGTRPPRPQGPPPSQRRRPEPDIEVTQGPPEGPPPRPAGPPPSQRRRGPGGPPPQGRPVPPPPERPGRKIIGLEPEPPSGGPPRPRPRRPPAKRMPPRSALGARRPRRPPEGQGPAEGGE